MSKARAIAQLYPDAVNGVDYLVAGTPQGEKIVLWNLPVPKPSESDLLTAGAAAERADKQKDAARKGRRQVLDSTVASVVGQDARNLRPDQVRDLLVELLERQGALGENYTVLPPQEWRR